MIYSLQKGWPQKKDPGRIPQIGIEIDMKQGISLL